MEQGEFEYEGTKDKWIAKNPSALDIAAFTTKFVLEDNKVITYVTHDMEDGAWQFFSEDKFDNFESVAKIIGLKEIMDMDPTLTELINMGPGHVATRKNKEDKWTIRKAE
jgi:hypothetical protein